MLKIDGLEIEEEIHNSQNSIIYKANDKANLQSKVLKILKDSSPSPEKLQKFFLEFQILKKFNHEGIVKPIQILEINGSNPVFIMDYGGESIRKILFKKNFPLKNF
ncbi:MAG: hypothetical protein KDK36_20980 [Leptospiraceae bacterium]|nr:hypothetical protein [Leptospiraceae bacterium]